MTRDQVANIETGRSPLTVLPGVLLITLFHVHPTWLAVGIEPMRPLPELDRVTIALEVQGDWGTFLEFWAMRGKKLGWVAADTRQGLMVGDGIARAAERKALVAQWTAKQDACGDVADFLFDFWAVSGTSARSGGNIPLTDVSEYGNNARVKLTMRTLIDRARRVVEAKGRGARIALAGVLGVSPSRVSEWLADKGDPSGSATLQLLQWVEAEERQQTENPSGDATPPGRKTRNPKSSEIQPSRKEA
jgi:transcriptional regulator with XRE-family HTH domain